MSYIQKDSITVTVAADGTATAYSERRTGKISQIRYVKNNFANGVDFTITVEGTGETVWTESNVNASKTCAPRQATHGTDGVASLYAGSGTAVQDKVAVAEDRVKIAIAQGSAGSGGETGTFHILWE